MQKLHQANLNRALTGVLSLMMLAVMLFSAFYLTAEAVHECSGEECPVCAVMQQCENLLHQIGSGITILAAVILPILLLFQAETFSAYILTQETPVSLKIRLNN